MLQTLAVDRDVIGHDFNRVSGERTESFADRLDPVAATESAQEIAACAAELCDRIWQTRQHQIAARRCAFNHPIDPWRARAVCETDPQSQKLEAKNWYCDSHTEDDRRQGALADCSSTGHGDAVRGRNPAPKKENLTKGVHSTVKPLSCPTTASLLLPRSSPPHPPPAPRLLRAYYASP